MATEIIKRFRVEGKARTAAARAELKKMARSLDTMGKRADGTTKEMEALQKRMAAMQRTMEKTEKRSALLGKVLGAAGLATSVIATVKSVDALVTRGQQLQDVMGNLPFSIDAAAAATDGMVDKFTLAKAAISANRLGVVKTAEEFANLARAGSRLSRSMGGEATKGVEDLTTALARQSSNILDNLGLALKIEQAQKEYAEELETTVDKLTEAEKKQAFAVVGMKKALAASEKLKLSVKSGAAEWVKTKTLMLDMANDAIPYLADALGGLIKGLDFVTTGLAEIFDTIINGTQEARTAFRSLDQELAARGDMEARARLDAAARQAIEDQTAALREKIAAAKDDIAATREMNALIAKQVAKAERKKKGAQRGGGGLGFDPAAANRDFAGPTQIDVAEAQQAQQNMLDNVIQFEEAKARITFDRRLRSIEEQRAAGVEPLSLIDQELAAKMSLLQAEEDSADRIQDVTQRRIELADIQNQKEQAVFDARMQRFEIERQQLDANMRKWSDFAQAVAGSHAQTLAAALIASKGNAAAFFRETKALATQKAIQATVIGVVELAKGAAAAASFNAPAAAAHFSAATFAFAQAGAAAAVAGGAALIGRGAAGQVSGPAGGLADSAGFSGPGGGFGGGGVPAQQGGGGGGRSGVERPAIPRSAPGPTDVPPANTGSAGGGGTTIININGGLFADGKEELGQKIRELTAGAEARFGS